MVSIHSITPIYRRIQLSIFAHEAIRKANKRAISNLICLLFSPTIAAIKEYHTPFTVAGDTTVSTISFQISV